LFESAVFLVGQHMAQFAVTGTPAAPMPARVSAWAVYEIFQTAEQESIFVGVVTDGQWRTFCEAFELRDFASDESLMRNSDRVRQRDRIIPVIRETIGRYRMQELVEKLEGLGLPFAPVKRPEEMFEDPHLTASGGLLQVTLTDGENRGRSTRLPGLPVAFDDQRPGLRHDVPGAGEHTEEILSELGYSRAEIARLAGSS